MSDVQKNSIYIWTPLHNHMHEQIIAAKQSCVKCSQSCLVKCSQSSARPSHDTFVIRFQLRPIFGYFHRQIAICWVVATGICHRRQPYLCNHHRRFVPHSLQMENLLCKSCFIQEYSQHSFVKLYFRMIWFVFCQKLGLFRWMQFICEWYNGILIQSFEMFFLSLTDFGSVDIYKQNSFMTMRRTSLFFFGRFHSRKCGLSSYIAWRYTNSRRS